MEYTPLILLQKKNTVFVRKLHLFYFLRFITIAAVCVWRSLLVKIVNVAIHVNECAWFPYANFCQRSLLGSVIIIGGCLQSKFQALFAGDSCLLLQFSMIMNRNNPQYTRAKYDSKTEIFCNFSVCKKDLIFFLLPNQISL